MISVPRADPVTQRLVQEADAALTAARVSLKRAATAARRLQRHVDQLADLSGKQLVQVRRTPPRDAEGKVVRQYDRRGRPKGVTNGSTALTLYATPAQIAKLRARLSEQA